MRIRNWTLFLLLGVGSVLLGTSCTPQQPPSVIERREVEAPVDGPPAIYLDQIRIDGAPAEIVSLFWKETDDDWKGGLSAAMSRADADTIIENQRQKTPDAAYDYWSIRHALVAVLAGAPEGTQPSRISRKGNNLILFGVPDKATNLRSSFQAVGIRDVRRQEHTVDIDVTCRLTEPPTTSEWKPGMCLVAIDVWEGELREWPLGKYEFNVNYYLLDDIYLKEVAPQLRPVKRTDQVQQRVSLHFELTE